MMALAGLWGLVLGLGLWSLLTVVWPETPRNTWARTMAPYLLDVSERARDLHAPSHSDPLVVAGLLLGPSLSRGVLALDRVLGGRDAQRVLFAASGLEGTFENFRATRTVGGIAGMGAGVVLGAALSALTTISALQGVLAGALLGVVMMVVWRDRMVTRAVRERKERITEEFPSIIELLGLALAAGDSLPRALTRVSRRAHGELGREWARVMALVDLGASLTETLRESATRVDAPHVSAFVEHLAQALDRGAPLAEVVSAHARDAKEEYTRGLVDRAGKAEVQMLVPMVLLILPVTVIFAVYPGLQALQFGF
jgi:tight adherence protein C